MNNKISEFINVAARQFEQEVGSDTMRLYYDRAMEIFAELIVKECISICETACLPIDVNLWRDMTKTAMSAYTARALGEEIKKHFGI